MNRLRFKQKAVGGRRRAEDVFIQYYLIEFLCFIRTKGGSGIWKK